MANLEFNKNDDKIRLLISEMKRKHATVSLGGGKKKIEKQHAKGKLTARERIDYLKVDCKLSVHAFFRSLCDHDLFQHTLPDGHISFLQRNVFFDGFCEQLRL